MSTKIKPYTTKLNKDNAYWMAKLSKAVYLAEESKLKLPDTQAIMADIGGAEAGFIDIVPASKNSAQGILVEHQDYYCLAFRGTDEIGDWLDNLEAVSTAELFGHFHRGFWNSVQDIWEILFGQYRLKIQQNKKKPLFLTGHSLGGAMATIAAAILVHRDLPFTSCYTFGQPRVMDKETASIFNIKCKERFFRFHNNNDIVTRVPARVMGFSHVGDYLYISQEEVIHQEPGFWFKFVDYVDGTISARSEEGIDFLTDHDMSKYLKAIESWQFEN